MSSIFFWTSSTSALNAGVDRRSAASTERGTCAPGELSSAAAGGGAAADASSCAAASSAASGCCHAGGALRCRSTARCRSGRALQRATPAWPPGRGLARGRDGVHAAPPCGRNLDSMAPAVARDAREPQIWGTQEILRT